MFIVVCTVFPYNYMLSPTLQRYHALLLYAVLTLIVWN